MDIHLLTVNVGNSRLAMGSFVAGEMQHVTRVTLEQADGAIAAAWKQMSDLSDVAIAGASVNPKIMESLEHQIHKTTGKGVQWIGREIDLPCDVKTKRPNETGVDRIVNIAAAYEQMEKACVVVDAGSAITIDCCDDKGAFLGGAIAPGVAMQLDVLHEKTARLPRVKLEVPSGAFGDSTEDAIRQGVYHGVRGMVKELVEQYAVELGQWPEIIATGGDAQLLFKDWELIHAISPDLTLYGIALAYTNHYLKHDR